MCCGQKRSELRGSPIQKTVWRVPQRNSGERPTQTSRIINTQIQDGQAPSPVSVPHTSVNIRYVESLPIRVRGLVSGVSYEFSSLHAVQAVDARDALSLLNTRFFRRA